MGMVPVLGTTWGAHIRKTHCCQCEACRQKISAADPRIIAHCTQSGSLLVYRAKNGFAALPHFWKQNIKNRYT